MKKTLLTFAIVLGISMSSFAQWGGGLFQYGEVSDQEYYYGSTWYTLDQNNVYQRENLGLLTPGLPIHGVDYDMNAPLGSGALLLIGFGAAYAMRKKSEVRSKK